MAYTAKLTYPVYDSNSSLFLEELKAVLQAEFTSQRSAPFSKTFLPKVVKTDEYLLSPIADQEIDPAFCSIIKAKMKGTENRFSNQQNELNYYIVGVLADGLTNLRKILDAISIILNDMDVKIYLFQYKNALGENLMSDSGQYMVESLSTEYEVSKTMNNKNIVYGSLILQAEIAEIPKLNTYTEIEEIELNLDLGANEININQTTNLE